MATAQARGRGSGGARRAGSRGLRARVFGDRWTLRRGGREPAYAQIEEQLSDRIEAGRLPVGERLPPERELADMLGVSRMTVRQALTALADRGLVERGVGRGTFVSAPPKVVHDLSRVAGFTEQMERQGLEPGARLLAAGEHPAPAAAAAALGLEPGDPVARVQRMRSCDGQPLTLEDSWFPVARCPGLLELDLTGSIYVLLRDLYALEPIRAVERLEPVSARAHEVECLGVPEGSPVMLVERVAYAAGNVPVEFARDRHRGDRARFVVEVSARVAAGR